MKNSPIPLDTNSAVWGSLSTPAYCWYVPSYTEFNTLTTFLGGTSVAGGKLKESGTTHWEKPNTSATNSFGFTGLRGGNRAYNTVLFSVNEIAGYLWSTTSSSSPYYYYLLLNYDSHEAPINGADQKFGLSVRCLKRLI